MVEFEAAMQSLCGEFGGCYEDQTQECGDHGKVGETSMKVPFMHTSRSKSAEARMGTVRKAGSAKFVEPMKAKLQEEPPAKGDWIYEIKFDGFRALAVKNGRGVELLSRNEKDFGLKFPDVAAGVSKLKASSLVIDGEIVALDAEGRSSFQLLQRVEIGAKRPPIRYYAFDLLHLDGQDLRQLPLELRKAHLKDLLGRSDKVLLYSADIGNDPCKLLENARSRGLEGIIGKRRNSPYESGYRTGTWIKLKCLNEQEFVIGGYTQPQGSRKHIGSILAGYYENGHLKFAGKVGTGFNAASLQNLHDQLQKLRHSSCPFSDLPEKRAGRWAQNITPAEMNRCTWVAPELVCQVRFTEWTRDGKLRHPVFLGLREDKDAKEVVREN